MDVGLLKVFQAVAEEGSISKAAQRLGYVQSNVTARIQQLEQDLGVPLFYRHHRGMTLTSPGQKLLTYTEKILYLFEEAKRAVQDSPTPRGPLTIGAIQSTAAVRLPGILARYYQQFPEVDLNLVIAPTVKQVEAVLNHQVEGAFVDGPIEHPEIVQEKVFDEHLVLVTRAELRPLDLAEVQKLPLLLPFAGCVYRKRWEHLLRDNGLLPMKVIEFSTQEGILGLVRSGFGVTLLPKSTLKPMEGDDELAWHPLPLPYGDVPTVFIRRRDLYVTSALLKLLEIVREETES
jgi:DNA-binding transcriptional LysR family regulator